VIDDVMDGWEFFLYEIGISLHGWLAWDRWIGGAEPFILPGRRAVY
jgi:hypothetical protein